MTGAQGRLNRLERCQRIVVMRPGDEDLVCANDMVAIIRGGSGWVHDPAEIRHLREQAGPGWPNESESELRAAWGDR